MGASWVHVRGKDLLRQVEGDSLRPVFRVDGQSDRLVIPVGPTLHEATDVPGAPKIW